MDYKKYILNNPDYDFLRKNEHLGDNIILLTLGGSYAYGTNNENSDVDVRGIALERPTELIGLESFDHFENKITDTTVYSLRKIVSLLCNCNPNCVEILATNPEHLLILKHEGKLLRDNIHLFLSQRASNSFGGYAMAQLRRLQNALARDHYPEEEKIKHITNTIKNQMFSFNERYKDFEDGNINIYIENNEILMDVNLNKYPLQDYKNIWSEMNNVVKDYNKLNNRNKKKDDDHLFKHGMHLIRLLLMGTEILKGEPVQTYRPEREFLLDIRSGKYSFNQIFEIVDEKEKEFNYAKENSSLPLKPDYHKINNLVCEINKSVIVNGANRKN